MDKAFEKLLDAATGLPVVEEGTSYGTPALKVWKKLLARVKDPETVVLMCPIEEKEVLLSAAPEIFYETDHYRGWPAILARIELISRNELRHHIERAWRQKAPKRLVEAFERDGGFPSER